MHTKPSAHKGKDQAARNQTCFIISTPLSLGFVGELVGEVFNSLLLHQVFSSSCLLFSFYCSHLCTEVFLTPLGRENSSL